LRPENAAAHLQLGLLLSAKGNVKEAIAHEEEAIRLDPKSYDAYINLGNVYLDARDYDNAKTRFERALAMAKGHPNALSGLGWALAEKGFVKDGIKKQEEAIRNAPYFAPAHTRLGMLLARSGNAAKAEQAFQNALKVSPKSDASASLQYAKFLAQQGKKDEAKAQFKKALEINPQLTEAKQALASLESTK
jgi:tetratricopeptide (TPR) repeat protein